MEAKPIEIPTELLQEFSNPPGEPMEPEAEGEALQSFGKFLDWIVETADAQAKQMGYTGTGKVPPKQLAELYTIVAKRNISEDMLKKTPEAAALTLTVSIIGMNLADHRRKKLEAQKQNSENE